MSVDYDELPEDSLDLEQAWQDYGKLPDGGEYYPLQVTEVTKISANKSAKGTFISASVDFKVTDDHSKEPGRSIKFQNLNGFQVIGLLKQGAGLEHAPTTVKEFAEALRNIQEDEKVVLGYVDWSGFSVPARNEKLLELTGAETIAQAKDGASKEQWKEANKHATIFSSMKEFPKKEDGTFDPEFICPFTKEQLTAQLQVRKFRPAKVA